MAVRSADAVRAGVATADDHHMLALGRQGAVRGGHLFGIAGHATVLLGQEVHGEVDALQLAVLHLEVAGLLGAASHDQHVVIIQQALDRDIHAHFEIGAENDPFGLHLAHPTVDQVLLHLEVRDAVAHQAADPVALLEHGRRVAGAGQLLRAGQARRAGADDSDPLARAARRGLRRDPAFFPALVDDLAFDRLDGHRRVDDVQGAGGLAGRGADTAGELREVVGRLQVLERRQPLLAIDEVVEVRDLVVHRTAVVTVGNPTVHAAGGLLGQLRLRQRAHELVPGLQARLGLFVAAVLTFDLKEACGLSHGRYSDLRSYSAATAAAALRSWASSSKARR